MSTDYRALCARMADELDHYRQVLSGDRRDTHALAREARAALAEPQPPTFLDAIRLAKGSHDYSGGYGGTPCDEAFHAGIGTVINVLTKAATGPWDYQTKAVFEAGEPQPPAAGEVGYLVRYLRDWGDDYSNATLDPNEFHRAADLLERLAATVKQSLSVEPTDEDLLASLRYLYADQTAADMGAKDDLRTARAVLARWGNYPATGKPALQVEPTDEELNELFVQFDPTGQAECWRGYARAVLARWDRSTPQPIPVPVSERLPEAGDCDEQGRCWLCGKAEGDWRLINPSKSGVPQLKYCFSHWLPAHALPLPSVEVE